MASAWGNSWGLAWGNSWGGVDGVTHARRRPGAFGRKRRRGAYPPERFYLPPTEKLPSLTQVKRIYQAARTQIPEAKQRDLIPVEIRTAGTSTAKLPQPQFIDFEKLRADLGTLRDLIQAVERAEIEQIERERIAVAAARKQKRQRDEEALIKWLMEID